MKAASFVGSYLSVSQYCLMLGNIYDEAQLRPLEKHLLFRSTGVTVLVFMHLGEHNLPMIECFMKYFLC